MCWGGEGTGGKIQCSFSQMVGVPFSNSGSMLTLPNALPCAFILPRSPLATFASLLIPVGDKILGCLLGIGVINTISSSSSYFYFAESHQTS